MNGLLQLIEIYKRYDLKRTKKFRDATFEDILRFAYWRQVCNELRK